MFMKFTLALALVLCTTATYTTAAVVEFPSIEKLAADVMRDWPVDEATAETVAKLVLEHATPEDLLRPELTPVSGRRVCVHVCAFVVR